MDEDSIKLHIENIKELILDEEKLITYCWLSKKLCVHVNFAKVLLEKFVNEHRKKYVDIPLQVTYMVSGTHDDGTMFIKVVSDDEYKLLSEKLCFSHIYSVRKGQGKLDLNSFNLLNELENFDNYIGLIQNELTAKISENEIDKLKQSSYAVVDKTPIKVETKTSGKIKLEKATGKNEDKIKNEPPSDKKKSSVNNGVNNKQAKINGNIQSMFNVQNAKPATQESKSDNKKTAQPKSNEITGFFKKQPTNSTSKSSDGTKHNENVNGIKRVFESPVVNEIIKSEPESPKTEKSKNMKTEERKKKVISKSRKKGKVDNKRKRVLQVSDSEESAEDDDPFEDKPIEQVIESDEDTIPPTPTPLAKVKMVSSTVNPKKRRKIVDKTYTGEDGYILTRKEEVYESCSEKEEENIVKKEEPQKENIVKKEEPEDTSPVKKFVVKETKMEKNKKQSPAAKGKQQTLTSFFTKKT